MRSTQPVFGKRNRATPARMRLPLAPRANPEPPPANPDHRAFFATARADLAETETRTLVVPRSFRAALLAGLVVGACLAGLDVTRFAHPDAAIVPLLQLSGLDDTRQTLPYMMALSLFSGARIAGATLLLAHRCLAWAGQTSHAAYALGGAVMTSVYAGLMMAITCQAPTHGWLVSIAAGAGSGFFYRMFAGAAPARS